MKIHRILTVLLLAGMAGAQSVPVTTNLALPLIPDGLKNWGPYYRTAMNNISAGAMSHLTTTGTGGPATFSAGVLNIPQYQRVITLTTIGSSGPATFDGTTLNIPQYSGGVGAVSSVFGRTGAVAAASNDYTFSLIGGNLGTTQGPTSITGIVKDSAGTLSAAIAADFPTLNQNTAGTAANLSGTPALPNGTTATTQPPGDNTTKLATDAFVIANAGAVNTIGVTTANGVSGSSSGGANPSLTIALGAITPTSVVASGAISGSSVSAGSGSAACGSATGCIASVEASTAGTPTAANDYCRADSTAHGYKCSLNNGAEFTSLMNFSSVAIGSQVSGLGTGVGTFLGTPTSANLAAALTDETGTGAAVFAGSPALTGTPTAPTATVGTNTTQLATTAFVLANAGSLTGSVNQLVTCTGTNACSGDTTMTNDRVGNFTLYPAITAAQSIFLFGNTANANGSLITINTNTSAGVAFKVQNQFGTGFGINSDGSVSQGNGWQTLNQVSNPIDKQVPILVASAHLTAQSGNKTAVTFATTPAAGKYEVCGTLNVTTAGTAGTYTIAAGWNNGAAQTFTSAATPTITANFSQTAFCYPISVASGNVTYSVTGAGVTGSPAYSLDMWLKVVD